MGASSEATMDPTQIEIVNSGIAQGKTEEEIQAELARYDQFRTSGGQAAKGTLRGRAQEAFGGFKPWQPYATPSTGRVLTNTEETSGAWVTQPTDSVGPLVPQPKDIVGPYAPQPEEDTGPYAPQEKGVMDKLIPTVSRPAYDIPVSVNRPTPTKQREPIEVDYLAIKDAYRRRQQLRKGYAGLQASFQRGPNVGPLTNPLKGQVGQRRQSLSLGQQIGQRNQSLLPKLGR